MITRRAALFGALAIGSGAATIQINLNNAKSKIEIPYSQFLDVVDENQPSKITIAGDLLIAEAEGAPYKGFTRIPEIADRKALLEKLLNSDAEIWQEDNLGYAIRVTRNTAPFILTGITSTSSFIAFTDIADQIANKLEIKHLATNIDKDYKKSVAYHEAGHAVTGLLLPLLEPVNKATIKPGIDFLGEVSTGKHEKFKGQTLTLLTNELIVTMGGRAAEIVAFGKEHIGNGAVGDMETAKELATKMVAEYGMSEKIGSVAYEPQTTGIWRIFRGSTMSDAKQQQIESEVENLVNKALEKAVSLLSKNSSALKNLAEALLLHETITGADELRRHADLDEIKHEPIHVLI